MADIKKAQSLRNCEIEERDLYMPPSQVRTSDSDIVKQLQSAEKASTGFQ